MMEKKSLLKLVLLQWMLIHCLCSFADVPPTPYVLVSQDSKTLSFYYDGLMESRQGKEDNCFGLSDDWIMNTNAIVAAVIDPSFADYKDLTSTSYWFYKLSNLKSVSGLEYLDMSKVTDMSYMFYQCTQLTTVDLSSLNTASVTDMSSMFYGCRKLRTILVGDGWNTDNVTSSSNMFFGCSNLTGGDGTSFDARYVDKTKAYAGDGGYLKSVVPVNYTLSVKVSGNGSVTYNGNIIRDSTCTFTVVEGGEATLLLAPDGGNLINSVKVNGFDVTPTVSNKQYTINNISKDVAIEVEYKAFCSFTIISTGNGYVAYRGIEVRDDNKSYTIIEGSSEEIAFFPDNDNRMRNIKVNGEDITQSISKNRFNVDITGNTTVEVVFSSNEAYAVQNGSTLSFYYDVMLDLREGNVYAADQFRTTVDDGWAAAIDLIDTVRVDASFALYQGEISCAYWFYGFTNLKAVEGMQNLFSTARPAIGENAFGDCRSLESVTIPNSVRAIGNQAFAGCSNLKEVVSEIETPYTIEDVFTGISADARLQVPKGTKEKYLMLPGWYSSFKEIIENETDADIEAYAVLDGTILAFYYDRKKQQREGTTFLSNQFRTNEDDGWAAYKDNIETVVVDAFFADYQGLESIAWWFSNCSNLKSVEGLQNLFSAGLSKISSHAFYGCSGLTYLTIPEGVTAIEDNAFYGCSREITSGAGVRRGVVEIDPISADSTFSPGNTSTHYSGLKRVSIPKSVTSIGSNAFVYCRAMTTVICMGGTVPTADLTAFEDSLLDKITLYVPEQSIDAYKAMALWSSFKEILPLPETVGITAPRTSMSSHIYDLNGRRVKATSPEGLSKGIYIINRKKVVIK